MTRFIKRLDDALARIEKCVIVACFALLVAAVLFSILSRNLFHLPSHRIFESAPSLVLWMALLGASLALKQRRHIRLELVLRYCSQTVRKWSGRVVSLFGAAVMAGLLITSIDFVRNEIAMFGGWGWLAIIFPIFFGSTAFRYLAALMVSPDSHPSGDSAATGESGR
ncbi:TRAP transporter small permease [Desulfosarcina widdelii]|uniref:TRAP transporter small permease n=1 Tax=Desulfosarcina widdelii TaxID=947919 RepID=UPI0014794AB8|nr:TRAP transporter small permease [Desulfosarcina widdelii]